MKAPWIWTTATLLLASGCGGPFGPCFSERVEAAFAGSLDGAARSGAGQVAPGNIPAFDALRGFLIDGQAVPGQLAAWTVEAIGPVDFLAIRMPAGVQTAQVLGVTEVVQAGGWGLLAGSLGGVSVSARIAGGYSTAGSGTVVVVGVAPLRLRLDLTLRDAGGLDRRLVGDVTFSYRRDRTTCT